MNEQGSNYREGARWVLKNRKDGRKARDIDLNLS